MQYIVGIPGQATLCIASSAQFPKAFIIAVLSKFTRTLKIFISLSIQSPSILDKLCMEGQGMSLFPLPNMRTAFKHNCGKVSWLW